MILLKVIQHKNTEYFSIKLCTFLILVILVTNEICLIIIKGK